MLRLSQKILHMEESQMKYKAEVKVDDEWCSNALKFDTRKEAEEYVKDLHRRWLLTTDYRVVEEEK